MLRHNLENFLLPRIIILINLEVLCKGCEAGGAIGQPTALDLLKVPDGNDTGTTGGGGASRVGAGGGGGGGAARGQNYTSESIITLSIHYPPSPPLPAM